MPVKSQPQALPFSHLLRTNPVRRVKAHYISNFLRILYVQNPMSNDNKESNRLINTFSLLINE